MTEKKAVIALRLARLMRDEIAKKAPQGPYGRLKTSFRANALPSGHAVVWSIYYWALFVNDGRGPIHAGDGQLLFYRDPRDDPRVQEGYPTKPSNRRRLTTAEVRVGLFTRRLIRIGPGRSVGPTSKTRFIERGVAAGRNLASKAAKRFLQESVQEILHRKKTVAVTRISAVFGG